MFEDYKAQRPKTPPELVTQIERVHQLAEAFNLPIFEMAGYEGDDIIGTISTQAVSKGVDTLIITGDNDMLQVVQPGVRVMAPRRGFADTVVYDAPAVREKYGPYSIIIPYMPNEAASRLFSLWGAGTDSWGWCSFDATRMMAHIIAGEKGWDYPSYMSGSAADMLAHSKLIVIWGMDPTMGSCGPGFQFAWFIKLCREHGKKVIFFDPKYTPAAAVLADQWIPIKPGTDCAMFMALANVLFKTDRWDKEFVARYVEPKGFEIYRNYVMGLEDGFEKTPEWAEKECAVPSETIRALADLIATVKPAWLWNHWGSNRKSRGENTVRAFAALQAMLGYWGTPGGVYA